MLGLYYAPGACSMAAHIVMEESGEKYEPIRVDLANGEQRTETYLKINPQGRVPVLRLDNGEPLAENTAILPYLGPDANGFPIAIPSSIPMPSSSMHGRCAAACRWES
jgi:glutathione S-transferase